MEFQGLLFGDDAEAESQERARLAALEQKRAYAEARKIAWEEYRPFPEDKLKWCASPRDYMNAIWREAYRLRHATSAEYYLRSGSRSRAARLGCKIGRSRPILRIYRRLFMHQFFCVLCYWCKKITGRGERHVDHKEPLSNGGAHVSGNLCIACIECNLAKCDLNPADFRRLVANKRAANSLIAAEYFRQAQKQPGA